MADVWLIKCGFKCAGSFFLGFSGPILVIALLAFVYIIAFPRDDFKYAYRSFIRFELTFVLQEFRTKMLLFVRKKSARLPRFRLWTFPVIVDGPFGVVSAAEFIGIVLFSAYVLWTIIAYTVENRSLISKLLFPSNIKLYVSSDMIISLKDREVECISCRNLLCFILHA